MTAVHEVIARDGTCLYRGVDVELACEVYDAALPGAYLLCRQVWTAEDARRYAERLADAPIPYVLTVGGYAATRRPSTNDASDPSVRDASVDLLDASTPHAVPDSTADLFVVDTTNVVELRRRCPALFAPRPGGAA